MALEIWISLISAVTALVVSLINSWNNHQSVKKTAQQDSSLEILKHKFGLFDKTFSESVEALRESISSIQILKDDISLMLNSVNGSIDYLNQVTQIKESAKKLRETFHSTQSVLSLRDTKVFHDAKDLSLAIELEINVFLTKKNYLANDYDEIKRKLMKYRSDLSEKQQSLLISRTDKLDIFKVHK